jgi:hypothetical protein
MTERKKSTTKKQKKSSKGRILELIVVIAIIAGLVFLYFSNDILQFEEEKASNIPQTKNNDTPQTIGKNLLLDPGFENISSLSPGKWGMAGYTTTNITAIMYNEELYGFKIENNTLSYHNEIKYNGSMSAYIKGVDVFNITVVSNWNQYINDTDIIPYGEDLILSCWIRTENADDVIMMIQCWNSEELLLDNLIKDQTSKSYGNINGTDIWKKYSIKLVNIPFKTKTISIRLGLIGTGEVWFDDVELFSVG